jgi:hypothetical protein
MWKRKDDHAHTFLFDTNWVSHPHACSFLTPNGSRIFTYVPLCYKMGLASSHMFLIDTNWVSHLHICSSCYKLGLTPPHMFLVDTKWVSHPHIWSFFIPMDLVSPRFLRIIFIEVRVQISVFAPHRT